MLYLRLAPEHHVLALLDSDFGDDSQTLNESLLLTDGIGEWGEECSCSSPGAVLEVVLDVEQVHPFSEMMCGYEVDEGVWMRGRWMGNE